MILDSNCTADVYNNKKYYKLYKSYFDFVNAGIKASVVLRTICRKLCRDERNRSGLLCMKYNPSMPTLAKEELWSEIQFEESLISTSEGLPGSR